MDYIYHADIIPEDGEFEVYFPDVPEAITGGKTRPEAMINAADCLGTALTFYFDEGKELPEAKYKGGIPIQPGMLYTAHFETVRLIRQSGLSIAELARRMGRDEAVIRRILQFKRGTTIPALELVLRALGKRLALTVEDLPG